MEILDTCYLAGDKETVAQCLIKQKGFGPAPYKAGPNPYDYSISFMNCSKSSSMRLAAITPPAVFQIESFTL